MLAFEPLETHPFFRWNDYTKLLSLAICDFCEETNTIRQQGCLRRGRRRYHPCHASSRPDRGQPSRREPLPPRTQPRRSHRETCFCARSTLPACYARAKPSSRARLRRGSPFLISTMAPPPKKSRTPVWNLPVDWTSARVAARAAKHGCVCTTGADRRSTGYRWGTATDGAPPGTAEDDPCPAPRRSRRAPHRRGTAATRTRARRRRRGRVRAASRGQLS